MSRSSGHDGQVASPDQSSPQVYISPAILNELRHLDLSGHINLQDAKIIGVGAYGDVLKSKCILENRGEIAVAVKRLRFHMREDIEMIFQKEIYVWSRLDHPNVLSLSGFAFEEPSGYPLLVSEWMSNGSSWTYVKDHSDCDLTRLVSGIAKGLAYLHDNGIVHSDIKPDNIVVTDSGDGRICDFGGSRITAASKSIAKTSTGIHGTLQYLAYELVVFPDQFPSHTKESDVWAFGMTVFSLIAQEYPYNSLRDEQVKMAITNHELPSFLFYTSRSSEERAAFRNVCHLCWEFEPTRRPQMSLIVSSLQHIEQQALTRPADELDQAGRDKKRRKASTCEELTDLDLEIETTEDGMYEPLLSLSSSLEKLEECTGFLSEVYQHLIGTRNVFTNVYYVIDRDFQVDGKLDHLLRSMAEVFARVSRSYSTAKDSDIKWSPLKLLQQATECFLFIRRYSRLSFEERQYDLSNSRKMVEFVRFFVAFKDALDSGSNMYPAFITSRTSLPFDDSILRQRLNTSTRETETYPHATCLSGTRVGIQEQIIRWAQSDSHQNIFWLHGVAGSGKSTVAASIEEYFRGIYRLGACLTFNRGKSDPSSVICALALKLASFDSTIGRLIQDETDRNKDIISASLTIQIEKLIIDPLNAGAAAQHGPILIILDALDECGTPQTRKSLIQILLHKLPKLPSNFRFLITSRREPDIEKIFLSQSEDTVSLELDYTSDTSKQDVSYFIRTEMHIAVGDIPEHWPWEENMVVLSKAAGGLFIWASTAVKLVQSSLNPFKRLRQLVSDSRLTNEHGLYELYSIVMRDSGIPWENEEYRSCFKEIAGLVVFSKVPLTIADIDGLLGLPSYDSSRFILSKLRCLLAYSTDSPIHLLHTSFAEYLLSSACLSPCPTHGNLGDCIHSRWFIDADTQKASISRRCFSVMKSMLRFNIGRVNNSYTCNDCNLDSQGRIDFGIPSHLSYACRFWAQHLCDTPFEQALLVKLSELLYKHFLYWLEALSLLDSINIVGPALLDTEKWIRNYNVEIAAFVKEARRLVNIFALPISQSVPHIYISMLSLTTDESMVSAHYIQYTSSLVRVNRRGVKRPSPLLKHLEGHASVVSSVNFSSDGLFIVSGSFDKTVRIWDTERGEPVAGPFDGSVGAIYSVIFLPDGTRIVVRGESGIVVMDVETGNIIVGPFGGEPTSSIALSPDGKRIASKSLYLNVVNIRDIESGAIVDELLVGELFVDPSKLILCFAFSSDGCFIASGSTDGSFCVWDVESRGLVNGPFLGHSSGVTSVAFSPDDKYVVSGSRDNTVRIWVVEKGEVDFSPLTGHQSFVLSVVYSSDGTRIVSDSYDSTVRIWNAQNGLLVAGPFLHPYEVDCVAISPDGTRVVSGAVDSTLRIWDAESGTIDIDYESELDDGIEAVRFSVDGSCIISDDGTTWCIENDTVVFKGSNEGEWRSLVVTDGMQFNFNGTLEWNLYTGTVTSHHNRNEDYPQCIAVSPNGKRFAFSSRDGSIRVWDEEFNVLVCGPFEGQKGRVSALTFSPDGRHLASGSGSGDIVKRESGEIRVWDVETEELIFGPFTGDMAAIKYVAYSPDNKYIASCSGKTIRVWHLETGRFEAFEGHSGSVMSVAYSPDGSRIVSNSHGEIRVWITSPLKVLANMDQNRLLAPNIDVAKWTLDGDGWIRSVHGELLLWVPYDLRSTLCGYQNITVLNREFTTALDFSNSFNGESWHKCFLPPE